MSMANVLMIIRHWGEFLMANMPPRCWDGMTRADEMHEFCLAQPQEGELSSRGGVTVKRAVPNGPCTVYAPLVRYFAHTCGIGGVGGSQTANPTTDQPESM